MRKPTFLPSFFLLFFLFLSSTMLFSKTVNGEDSVVFDKSNCGPASLGSTRNVLTEPIVIQPGRSPAGRFNARMIFLADQLERNIDRKSISNTFVVTSFTNINRISETSGLGRLIAENLIHELQVRRWNVYEMRLSRNININENGEFSLSRDSGALKGSYKLGGVVTGTYSMAGNDIIINARVVDIPTGLVTSSAQTRLPLDLFTEMLLFNKEDLPEMKIVGNR